MAGDRESDLRAQQHEVGPAGSPEVASGAVQPSMWGAAAQALPAGVLQRKLQRRALRRGAGSSGAGPIQRKEDPAAAPQPLDHDEKAEEGAPATEGDQQQVPQRIAAALARYTAGAAWPEEAPYKKAPRSYEELMLWSKLGHLTPKQKDYLYGVCELAGLVALGDQIKRSEAAGEAVDPRRTAIVSFALSQIGRVEAHTYSGQDAPGGMAGGPIKLCVGAAQLWDFHQRSGRGGKEEHVKDYRVRTDRDFQGVPGTRRPAWCQIFAQWAVTMAGGDASLTFDAAQKNPKPGDIAYMSDNDHMGVVLSCKDGQVTTVDGNTGEASGIVVRVRAVAEWSHGFHDSCPAPKAPVP